MQVSIQELSPVQAQRLREELLQQRADEAEAWMQEGSSNVRFLVTPNPSTLPKQLLHKWEEYHRGQNYYKQSLH